VKIGVYEHPLDTAVSTDLGVLRVAFAQEASTPTARGYQGKSAFALLAAGEVPHPTTQLVTDGECQPCEQYERDGQVHLHHQGRGKVTLRETG